MTPRALLVAVVAIVLAGVCVRMGAWQMSRWQQKRHANAALRASLAAPAVAVRTAADLRAAPAQRRLRLEGTFDESRQVLVSDRWRDERPGVELLTPLRLAGGGAVMVDRGWLPSADAITARPQDHPEPGARVLTALRIALPRGARHAAWSRLPGGPPELWSVRALDADSLGAHEPDAVSGWLLQALPDSTPHALPLRSAPEPADESMHLSYALQWSLFALAFLAGAALVAVREHAAAAAGR